MRKIQLAQRVRRWKNRINMLHEHVATLYQYGCRVAAIALAALAFILFNVHVMSLELRAISSQETTINPPIPLYRQLDRRSAPVFPVIMLPF